MSDIALKCMNPETECGQLRERAETAEAQWDRYRNEAAANRRSLCEALANNDRLSEINKELVAAFENFWNDFCGDPDCTLEVCIKARAALAKATEG